MPAYDFKQLETEVNDALEVSCRVLLSNSSKVSHYEGIFDRSSETGFYSNTSGPRGEGEQPTWAPNPAYMDSLEEMWHPVAGLLEQRGLRLEKSLRDLFQLSYEYKDRAGTLFEPFPAHLPVLRALVEDTASQVFPWAIDEADHEGLLHL